MWGQNAGQVSSFWFNCELTFYKRRDEYISRECPLAASLKCFYTESKYFPSFTDSSLCLQVSDTSEFRAVTTPPPLREQGADSW